MKKLPELTELEYKDMMRVLDCHFEVKTRSARMKKLLVKIKEHVNKDREHCLQVRVEHSKQRSRT